MNILTNQAYGTRALLQASAKAPAAEAQTSIGLPQESFLSAQPELPLMMKPGMFSKSTVPSHLSISAEERAAYDANNAEMAAKYPGMAVVLKDPDAFLAQTRERFNQQKAVNPEDPYSFDFSEYGIPFLGKLAPALDKEIAEVQSALTKLDGDQYCFPGWMTGRGMEIEDHKLGVAFLNDLKNEVAGHLDGGKISYRRLQEVSHFASHALGHFDHGKLSLGQKIFLEVDRHIEGHEDVTIKTQYDRYKANDFTVFQAKAGSKGYARVEDRYVAGFENKEQLELINLPCMEELENDIFDRMMNHQIYIGGVTGDPIPADGFVRPGGDFWLHDIRHNSGIFVERKDYIERNNLDDNQVAKLDKRGELWYRELKEELAKLDDKPLKGAAEMVSFNFHHDRGHLMVPSNYLKDGAGPVPRALYAALRLSGQGEVYGVGKDMPNLDVAHAWLQNFWLARLDQELEILGHNPVPNPHL